MQTIRSTLVFGLLLLTGACKAHMPASYADEAPPGDAHMGGVAATEMEPMDSPPSPRRESRAQARGERMKMAKDTMASPAPVSTPTTPDGTSTAEPEPAIEDHTQDLDARHIIYVANMTVAVFNLDDAMAKAESLPEAIGGYVHSMDGSTLVLRVPAKKLR